MILNIKLIPIMKMKISIKALKEYMSSAEKSKEKNGFLTCVSKCPKSGIHSLLN
jgi:hypothetical protein